MTIPISQFPSKVLRDDVDKAAQVEVLEAIPGEVEFDQVIKSQLAMPAITERMLAIEQCMCELAERLYLYEPDSEVCERAKFLLKNRMEVDEHVTASCTERRCP